MEISIVIADNHLMVREGLKQILELDDNISVIAEAGDGFECLNYINKLKPDIALVDINIPNLNGLQVLKIIKEQKLETKVIMLTLNREVNYIIEAMDLGCEGYVLKDSSSIILKKAIFYVCQGESFIDPAITVDLNACLVKRDMMQNKLNDLTKREIEVLKLLANGLFNKEIAATLNISEKTVKNHISNIFKKIDVFDRTQAAVFAIKNNLIEI